MGSVAPPPRWRVSAIDDPNKGEKPWSLRSIVAGAPRSPVKAMERRIPIRRQRLSVEGVTMPGWLSPNLGGGRRIGIRLSIYFISP